MHTLGMHKRMAYTLTLTLIPTLVPKEELENFIPKTICFSREVEVACSQFDKSS